jgi:hypothetical protein
MTDPLLPHLLDLLKQAPPDSFVLGGGFGLILKQRHLQYHRAATLAASAGHNLPPARATQDLDLFLKMEVFTHPDRGRVLRQGLDDLGYQVLTGKFQFSKPLSPELPGMAVRVDLLSRLPRQDEAVPVRGVRVGAGADAGVHGRKVPEAFAVDRGPVAIDVVEQGRPLASVRVPAPFAWLNMKVRAAHDWLVSTDDAQSSVRHAFDAALIVAMLTEDELQESARLAREFQGHPVGAQIREEAVRLFGTPESAGWQGARGQGMFDDHGLIWDVMREMLRIEK